MKLSWRRTLQQGIRANSDAALSMFDKTSSDCPEQCHVEVLHHEKRQPGTVSCRGRASCSQRRASSQQGFASRHRPCWRGASTRISCGILIEFSQPRSPSSSNADRYSEDLPSRKNFAIAQSRCKNPCCPLPKHHATPKASTNCEIHFVLPRRRLGFVHSNDVHVT